MLKKENGKVIKDETFEPKVGEELTRPVVTVDWRGTADRIESDVVIVLALKMVEEDGKVFVESDEFMAGNFNMPIVEGALAGLQAIQQNLVQAAIENGAVQILGIAVPKEMVQGKDEPNCEPTPKKEVIN